MSCTLSLFHLIVSFLIRKLTFININVFKVLNMCVCVWLLARHRVRERETEPFRYKVFNRQLIKRNKYSYYMVYVSY